MANKTEMPVVGSINSLWKQGAASQNLNVAKNVEDGQVVHLQLDQLLPSRYQTRRITPDRVRQLAETIKQQGLLQPVTARPVEGGKYELIAGHRRREAFNVLLSEMTDETDRKRWSSIPCVIRLGLSEVQASALTAVENLERDDGDPLEQGQSLLKVKQTGNFANNQQVAEATGLSPQKVTRLIRLAEAPEVIQNAVSPGVFLEVPDKDSGTRKEHRKLEMSLALAVVPFFKFHEKQASAKVATEKTARLLERAARGNWTRAKLEAEVKRSTGGSKEEGVEAEKTDASETARGEGDESAPGAAAKPKRQLYREVSGTQFVIYTKNLAGADPEDAAALVARLEGFIAQLKEAPRA